MSVACVNDMISNPPNSKTVRSAVKKNPFLILKDPEMNKNTEYTKTENKIEVKLKISVLEFVRKMCVITEKNGGFLQNRVSVCVWHLAPLLSGNEVRIFFQNLAV
jgi:hypothetical protein